jgi:hypothetical protein
LLPPHIACPLITGPANALEWRCREGSRSSRLVDGHGFRLILLNGRDWIFFLEDVTMKALLAMTLMATLGLASAADVSEIEKRRLFQPTQAELQEEAAGRIYIYDGLTQADIERAMDEEFNRVESMMFIRVKKSDEQGKVVKDPETGYALVEDDGC